MSNWLTARHRNPTGAGTPPDYDGRMNSNRNVTSILTALLLLPAGAALAAEPAPPVTRLDLYTNGVAYFEHAGTVEGNEEIMVPAAAADMDDLLQSLVLLDLDGGTVEGVRYGTEPSGSAEGPLGAGGDDNPALARLLLGARGAELEVELADGEQFSGRIVSIERVTAPDETERELLLLAAPAGLRRIALDEAASVAFTDEELQAALLDALAETAAARAETDRSLTVSFRGEGERRIRIGYVREMPVWKASYRLRLATDGTAELQGWALLDNTTDLELEDARITFTAGEPVSFITRLHEALHVERPYVDPPATRQAAAPPVQEESLSRMAAAAMAAPEADRLAAEEEAEATPSAAGGVEARASGSRAGATFRYEVAEPVTLGAHESAMIPVVQATVPAEQLSLFDPEAGSGSQPIRTVRLDNDTGLHLAAGTVTVFEQDAFTGTARLADVLPGGEPLLAFAADQSVNVRREETADPEEVVSAVIRDGVLITEVTERYTVAYELSRSGTEDGNRLVLIQQPRRSGHELHVPDGLEAERTDSSWRFPVLLGADLPEGDVEGGSSGRDGQLNCDTGADCTFEVHEERLVSRRVELSRLTEDELLFILSDTRLDAEETALLEDLLANGRARAAVERRLTALDGERDDIFSEQERIRSNMAELAETSDLYARYVSRLEEQEDRLEELAGERSELQAERAALTEQREELLGGTD